MTQEIISLSGLEHLWETRKSGEPLPDEWIELAEKYIEHKKWAVSHLNGPVKMRNQRIKDLQRAEILFKALIYSAGGNYYAK